MPTKAVVWALAGLASFVVASCGAPPRAAPPAGASAPSLPAQDSHSIPKTPDSADLAATISVVAHAALEKLPRADTEKTLLDRVHLEAALDEPDAVLPAIARLRQLAKLADPTRRPVLEVANELRARAKLAMRSSPATSFDQAFASSFHDLFGRLDDLAANHASWQLDGFDVHRSESELRQVLERLGGRGASALTSDDAVELADGYARWTVAQEIGAIAQRLVAEDQSRRYSIDEKVLLPTHDGATVSAIIVRPRRLTTPEPAILSFTIYTDHASDQAVFAAAHGYVGIAAFPRGKGLSSGPILPYEHDASDTHDTIDWISRQPWCDGRVGMYGGSYTGFAQWAATKRLHPALKTIVPYVAAIPGQGLPMENNVFLDANYGWAFYVGDGPLDDDKVYSDRNRWDALPGRWFASGRPYSDIDRIDGTPNPLLHRWIAHPAYDAYWQAMVPYAGEFARIRIPVLTVTGYYDDGQISALRYFTEHTKYVKGAEHYVVIGPWDHIGSQRRPSPVLRGYAIDEAAKIDVSYLTFVWLDHVLRGGPLPDLLADKINFEVMGANEWRHAPTLQAMRDKDLVLYLDRHTLSPRKPPPSTYVLQEVDLADRTTQNNVYYPDPIVHDSLDDGRGVVFESEALDAPMSIDGMFSGELRVSINKKDFDVGVELYEKTPAGKYFSLSYYLGRASYVRDITKRRLLVPGAVETLPFDRTRMVSRELSKGSRIVVVVNVDKNQWAQVNYGTGKDVSSESIADAGEPLRVRWFGDSFVRLPVRQSANR